MDITEDMWLDPANLSETTINGAVVPIFDQYGKRWYQLLTLLKALEFPEEGLSGLPTKIGNMFEYSGEFLKYKDIWYGTADGLLLYEDYLRIYQYSPTGSYQNKQTAHIRQLILKQWLFSMESGDSTPGTADGDGTAEQAPKNDTGNESNANDVSIPTETGNEQGSPEDAESSKPMEMATKPAGIDMALFERLYDNLLDRVPYMASCLSIPSDVSVAWKLFAVMAMGYLHGSEHITRPQNDFDGIWGQEQHLCVADAVRRSMLYGK